MHVTLRQLQIFEAVARHGSFTRAAEALHLTQPTVSIQVKQLSDAVGLPLLEVTGRKVSLTDVGNELFEISRQMNGAWERFEEQVLARKGLHQGRLRLSGVSTSKYFIPRLLGAFSHAYPGIELELEIVNHEGILRRLRENLDDLYVMSQPPSDLALSRHRLQDNPLVVVAPRDFMVPAQPCSLEDLSGERFILREIGSGTRRAVEAMLRETGRRLNVKLVLGSNEAVKQSVAAGLGLAILSRHALGAHPEEGGLKILDVRGFPLPGDWWVVHREEKVLAPVARAFLEYLLSHSDSFLPEMGT
jgi:DNA-binding transcriptional LysR family regulator